MCFSISKNCLKAKKAKEDIVCYKTLTSDMNSMYKTFKYKPNTTYRLWNWMFWQLKKKDAYDSIHKGFHSFIKYQSAINDAEHYSLVLVVEFIIPKGARYFINEGNGEYVSNKIKCIKTV